MGFQISKLYLSFIILLSFILEGCVPAVVATGAAAGTAIVADRRSSGTYVDDKTIELKSNSIVNEHPLGKEMHVNITSYNRLVLVTGEVPSDKSKNEIIEQIKQIPNVRIVYDELKVGPSSSLGTRANDTSITGGVKKRILNATGVSSYDVKVVTERSVVYLMGLLTQQEADIAAKAAQSTPDVIKVIRVVDYITDSDAKQLDTISNNKQPNNNTEE